METSQSNNYQQPLSKCEESYSLFYSLPSRLQLLVTALRSKLNHNLTNNRLQRLAHLVIQNGRAVVTAFSELLNSPRCLIGICLIGVIAPLSECAYVLFNPKLTHSAWYYDNMYWYLFTISNPVKHLFWSVGVFLLFPVKFKLRYLAVIMPACEAVTKIIHLSFFVTNNENFHNAPSFVAISTSIIIVPSILFCMDYLLYRKYHLNDGNLARINGIIKTPGIPAEKKIEILETLIIERENFYNRV